MRISKPKRAKGGAKRLDLSDMRHLFKDRRVWSAIGVVTAPEGEPHWNIVTNDEGTSVDVIVEVVLHPSEVPVTCRMPAGVWDVPDEGDEVGVILPDGEHDFMPLIVCRLSTNVVPTTQGPQPGRIVMVRDEVFVHDGAGGAVALALKSDVQDLADYVGTEMVIVTPSGNSTPGVAPDPSPQPPSPTGTTVLKAK